MRCYSDRVWLVISGDDVEVDATLFAGDRRPSARWYGTLHAAIDWFGVASETHEFTVRTVQGRVGIVRVNWPLVFWDRADVTGVGPPPF